jgi:hypothetical protein
LEVSLQEVARQPLFDSTIEMFTRFKFKPPVTVCKSPHLGGSGPALTAHGSLDLEHKMQIMGVVLTDYGWK